MPGKIKFWLDKMPAIARSMPAPPPPKEQSYDSSNSFALLTTPIHLNASNFPALALKDPKEWAVFAELKESNVKRVLREIESMFDENQITPLDDIKNILNSYVSDIRSEVIKRLSLDNSALNELNTWNNMLREEYISNRPQIYTKDIKKA
jgi:hypothetical protein